MEESVSYINDNVTNKSSVFMKRDIIYLLEIGKQYLFSPVFNKDRKASSYLFFIVNNGRGMLKYDGISQMISAGYCVFLDSRKPYCYYPIDSVLAIEYICFSGLHMEEIYEKFLRNASPCFCSYSPRVYREAWQQVYEIASADFSSSDDREMEMHAALFSLMVSLNEKEGNVSGRQKSKKKILQNVKEYLDQHYWEKISLDQLSEMFYINKFYLTKLFREQYGLSVNNYLIKARIGQAKELLRFSDLSIEQIGFECGIGNANYFSKVFKRWEGMSPGSFRKKERSQENSELEL